MPTAQELIPPQAALPPYARDREGDETGAHYLGSGRRFLQAAVARGLEPHHRVLDLGCGVGRFAVALAGFLEGPGSYVGMDVDRRSIRLCRRYIGSKLDNFRFVHVGLFNTEYNRSAAESAAEFRFPFKGESFDFAFSNSLFTHLVPEVAENYLTEISRVLRPGGRTMNTMLLLNDESLVRLDSTNSRQGPTHAFGGGIARVKDRENPEAWIAYDEAFIGEQHRRARLRIEGPIRYGSWSGREETAPVFGGKDIVVARKPAASPPKRLYRRLRRSIRRRRHGPR
jgi:SAM-dependent methyltransferase